MVHVPAAQPAPRVPRSRRDDRYETGRPAPPKRASAGYVVSIQDDHDTVTVDVLDEKLTGVIPLGEMPPVGAIVEVEARGDLLVIPIWYPGPCVDIIVTLPIRNPVFYSWDSTGLGGSPADGGVVGGTDALLADDGDSSYIELWNTAHFSDGKLFGTVVVDVDPIDAVPAGYEWVGFRLSAVLKFGLSFDHFFRLNYFAGSGQPWSQDDMLVISELGYTVDTSTTYHTLKEPSTGWFAPPERSVNPGSLLEPGAQLAIELDERGGGDPADWMRITQIQGEALLSCAEPAPLEGGAP